MQSRKFQLPCHSVQFLWQYRTARKLLLLLLLLLLFSLIAFVPFPWGRGELRAGGQDQFLWAVGDLHSLSQATINRLCQHYIQGRGERRGIYNMYMYIRPWIIALSVNVNTTWRGERRNEISMRFQSFVRG